MLPSPIPAPGTEKDKSLNTDKVRKWDAILPACTSGSICSSTDAILSPQV